MKSQRKKEDGGDVEVEPSHIDPIRSAQAPPVLDPMRSDAIRSDCIGLHRKMCNQRADGQMEEYGVVSCRMEEQSAPLSARFEPDDFDFLFCC